MPRYKESSFPITYRAREVRLIMDAVARRRSIAVSGLAGMGKSNLFRFIASHPHVKSEYLGRRAAQFAFVLVDCNLVAAPGPDAMLDELDEQLERAGLGLPKRLMRSRAVPLRRSIQYRLEAVDPRRVVVILLDPLDQAFRDPDAHFWAYLRGLRDLRGNVAFVLGARRPPPHLAELQEVMVEACWVTPLNEQDARDSLARDEERLGVRFSKFERDRLIRITGGHPGLLKNAAELVARGQVNGNAPPRIDTTSLGAHEAIQQVCRDLWSDLSLVERKTLQELCGMGNGELRVPPQLEPETLEFLQQAGLVKSLPEAPRIFSLHYENYIKTHLERVVRISINVDHAVRFDSWQGAAILTLSEGPFQLLRTIAQAPNQIHSLAQLSRALYSGDPDYSREAVAAQIKRLRHALNGVLCQILRDKDFNAILAARKQGYRLNVTADGGWQIEYHVNS